VVRDFSANKETTTVEKAHEKIDVKSVILAEQCNLAIVLTMTDGLKGSLFCEDSEEAEWLVWELNDAIALGSQSLLSGALEKIRPSMGENLKPYFS